LLFFINSVFCVKKSLLLSIFLEYNDLKYILKSFAKDLSTAQLQEYQHLFSELMLLLTCHLNASTQSSIIIAENKKIVDDTLVSIIYILHKFTDTDILSCFIVNKIESSIEMSSQHINIIETATKSIFHQQQQTLAGYIIGNLELSYEILSNLTRYLKSLNLTSNIKVLVDQIITAIKVYEINEK